MTDFGNIYVNTPSEIKNPKSSKELALLLKSYNKTKTNVTIRNTGHSVNGQTLTNGVQINISGINFCKFDSDFMEVTVGAGCSWDKMLKTIGFPNYCTKVFPNNPGQKIQVGGTAAVGGVSPYSFKYGGLWNNIKEITLVTMTGEIIKCSRSENFELMQYSLGGLGRIGVITEITLDVIKSEKNLICLGIIGLTINDNYENLHDSLNDEQICGAFTSYQLNGLENLNRIGIIPNSLFLILEPKDDREIDKLEQKYRTKFSEYLVLNLTDKKDSKNEFDVSFSNALLKKESLVYYFPRVDKIDHNLMHPWCDYGIPINNYKIFEKLSLKIIEKYGLEKFLMRQSILGDKFNLDAIGNYVIKKFSDDFPLTLDLNSSNFCIPLGVQPSIPKEHFDDAKKAHIEILNSCIELGGRPYMYGFHNLNKTQLSKIYGNEVLNKWENLKSNLDPNHLLNTKVIEAL